MAYNRIQSQQGMSLPEFLQPFGTESACCEAVLRARWPEGFACPRCGGSAHCVLFSLGRPLFQCHSEGLGCFAAVIDAGCTHTVEVVGQRKPRDLPQFKWVNTVLGTLETMISGSYEAVGYGKYAGRYLGAFAYRVNRRFDLADLVVRLVVDACRSAPSPERVIRQA